MSAREVWEERRDFQHAMQEDRRQRLQAEGANIKDLLESGRVKESWYHFAR